MMSGKQNAESVQRSPIVPESSRISVKPPFERPSIVRSMIATSPQQGGSESKKDGGSNRRSNDKKITVLIVDDERTFGEALELALEREKDVTVVDVSTDGDEAVIAAGKFHPDVVLMDVGMPRMNGLEATRKIKEANPESRVVLLSGREDEYLLARAVQAGATGLLKKTEAVVDLVSMVRRAYRGEPVLDDQEVEQALRHMRHRRDQDADVIARLNRLTPRELEILQLMAAGKSPPQIAATLGMSPGTLRTHTKHFITKLAVHSKMEALVLAIRHGKVATIDLTEEPE
jgi:NarL family two-component system response regulator LiaR